MPFLTRELRVNSNVVRPPVGLEWGHPPAVLGKGDPFRTLHLSVLPFPVSANDFIPHARSSVTLTVKRRPASPQTKPCYLIAVIASVKPLGHDPKTALASHGHD